MKLCDSMTLERISGGSVEEKASCHNEAKLMFGAKAASSDTFEQLYDSHLNTYNSSAPTNVQHSMALSKVNKSFFASSQASQLSGMSSLNLCLAEPETYLQPEKQVHSTLLEYLQPKKQCVTIESTATSLLNMLPKDKVESTEVWMFWKFCIDLAEQIAYHHPLQLKLVELMQYLYLSPQLSHLDEEHDSKVTINQLSI